MCRMAVYRGPAISLHQVIYDNPHNFIKQAQRPKEMVASPINGDGFGIAWYNLSASSEPALLTSEKPFWHDINLPRITDKIFSTEIWVHIRAASPGIPVHQANAHPFTYQNELFMHNGILSDFRSGFMRTIREKIDDPFYENIQGTTDSEHIFALYLTLRKNNPELNLTQAVHLTIDTLHTFAAEYNTDMVLNMVFSDGKTMVITRYTNIEKSASLYYSASSEHFKNGIIVASERFSVEDQSWKEFPLNELLVIEPNNEHHFEKIYNPYFENGILKRKAKPGTLLA